MLHIEVDFALISDVFQGVDNLMYVKVCISDFRVFLRLPFLLGGLDYTPCMCTSEEVLNLID